MWPSGASPPGHLAAAVGGLVYGFSPAVRGQSHHLHMSLAFLVPLMLLALHEIVVRQRRSPWLVGAGLGLMAGAQLLIGEELLAMTAVAVGDGGGQGGHHPGVLHRLGRARAAPRQRGPGPAVAGPADLAGVLPWCPGGA